MTTIDLPADSAPSQTLADFLAVTATVDWSGGPAPKVKTDVSLRSLFGRGGSEAFQMLFDGDGFVVVQPYEEKPASKPGG